MKIGYLILTSAVCGLLTFVCGCRKNADEGSARLPNLPQTGGQPSSSFASVSQPGSKNVEDAVLVTVDGKSLTHSMATSMAREMAARQGVPPQMINQFLAQIGRRLEQQAVEQFVNQSLVEKEIARLEIPVSEQEIDAAVARLTETLPEGMMLDQALAVENVGMADLRKNIASNERVRKLYESKTASAEPVTDAQVEVFYQDNTERFTTEDTVTASHILIACDETADAEAHAKAKAEAESILAQLDQGADFAELAQARSSCPSKQNGGSLPPFGRGQMVPMFEEAAFSQEIGRVGPVVKTKFGYHLIQVADKEDGGIRSLEDVSERIREHLDMQSREKLFSVFMDTLREHADITYASGAGF